MVIEASNLIYLESAKLNEKYFGDLFSTFLYKSRVPQKRIERQGAITKPGKARNGDPEPTPSSLIDQSETPDFSTSDVSSLPNTSAEASVARKVSSSDLLSGTHRPTDDPSLSSIPDGPIIGVNIELAMETLRQKIKDKNPQCEQRKKVLKSEKALLIKKKLVQDQSSQPSRRQLKNLKKHQKKEEQSKELQSASSIESGGNAFAPDILQRKKQSSTIELTTLSKAKVAKRKVKSNRLKIQQPNLDLSYGHLVTPEADECMPDRINPKCNRVLDEKRLDKLIAQRKSLENDPERQQKFKIERAWDCAAKKLSGVTSKDEVEVLKKTIKDKHRKKRKSARKWDERIKAADASKAARQEKRVKNIKDRIEAIKEKKLLIILKRKRKRSDVRKKL